MSQPPHPPEEIFTPYEEEPIGSGFIRLWKTKPDAMLGLTGMVGACGYAYWRYKTKGFTFSPSLFLIQLRVGAQATVIGCITLAMVYNMLNQHVLKNETQHKRRWENNEHK